MVVFPDASGPKISMTRPFGTPPQLNNSSSKDMRPVGYDGIVTPTRSPIFWSTTVLYSLLRYFSTDRAALIFSALVSGVNGASDSSFDSCAFGNAADCPVLICILLLCFQVCHSRHEATE